MIGAIIGDIVGSIYEYNPIKTKDFPFFGADCSFTDDTILTIAVAEAILLDQPYKNSIQKFGIQYPNAGYGGFFNNWLYSNNPQPYNSWGNGSAMRVSSIGFAFTSEKDVLYHAKKSAECTHNHSEGIKGAQATALAIFLARMHPKNYIKKEISNRFGYDLSCTINDIRPTYSYDVSCQGTVPEAIIAFLDSNSFEDAIRNAISLGGDSDTLACITGGIAEAFYGVPKKYIKKLHIYLKKDLFDVITAFYCFKIGKIKNRGN